MKKQDSKKAIPLATKKAEIIFTLPYCQPTGASSYYLPQIINQNQQSQSNQINSNDHQPHSYNNNSYNGQNQNAIQSSNQNNQGLNSTQGINRSASGIGFHTNNISLQQQNSSSSKNIIGGGIAQGEMRKMSSQKTLTKINHQSSAKLLQTQSNGQLLQSDQKKQQNIPPTIPFINLERDNYAQDIARRKLFMQDLHSDLSTKQYISEINTISKQPPKKKTRRHKTKFHIVKTNKNIEKLSGIICNFIQDNKKFTGSDAAVVLQYEKNAPFAQSTLDFADQLIEDKQHFKEKYGFDENNLRRNKCVLEQVVLNRMEKRVKAREKNSQLKKIKQTLPENPYYYEGNPHSFENDDIISRLEKPAENKNIALALPKIQETNEDEK